MAKTEILLSADMLRQIVKLADVKDSTRYALSHIKIEAEGDNITTYATNGNIAIKVDSKKMPEVKFPNMDPIYSRDNAIQVELKDCKALFSFLKDAKKMKATHVTLKTSCIDVMADEYSMKVTMPNGASADIEIAIAGRGDVLVHDDIFVNPRHLLDIIAVVIDTDKLLRAEYPLTMYFAHANPAVGAMHLRSSRTDREAVLLPMQL